MSDFRGLAAFNRGLDLVVEIYRVTSSFPVQERYGLTAQLRRASVGVVSQIAEGHGRLTYGEWRQFLSQARGSLFEIEAQVIVACRLGFLADEHSLNGLINHAGVALAGLIEWVDKQEREGKKRRRPVARDPVTS